MISINSHMMAPHLNCSWQLLWVLLPHLRMFWIKEIVESICILILSLCKDLMWKSFWASVFSKGISIFLGPGTHTSTLQRFCKTQCIGAWALSLRNSVASCRDRQIDRWQINRLRDIAGLHISISLNSKQLTLLLCILDRNRQKWDPRVWTVALTGYH